MPGPTRQSPGRSRHRRGGRERAEGRKDSEEPRQAGEFSYTGEKSGITGGAAPCPTSPQHIGIQAEICGMKVKLGGQLQSFLISSSGWLLSPLNILHTSSGLAAHLLYLQTQLCFFSPPYRQLPICITIVCV